jgi:hypothetical protein
MPEERPRPNAPTSSHRVDERERSRKRPRASAAPRGLPSRAPLRPGLSFPARCGGRRAGRGCMTRSTAAA